MTGLVPIGDGANFIRINSSSALDVTLDGTYNYLRYVELGYVFTGGGNAYIIEIVVTPAYVGDYPTNTNKFFRGCIRAMVSEGLGVSEQADPNFLKLSCAEGIYYAVGREYTLPTVTTFTKMFNNADFGWVPLTSPPLNTLQSDVWNDVTKNYGASLITLTDGYWKTDIIFRVPSGNVYAICGQAEYATEQEAKDAPLATLPSALTNVAILLAKITMQKGSTTIASGISDIRPYLPRVFGSASAGSVQAHSSLTGLNADDHLQYFNETRGDLRYAPVAKGVTNGDSHDHSGGDGGQISYTGLANIPSDFTPSSHGDSAHSETYVKTADSRLSDSRTPTAHASSHITGGSDIIANAVAGESSGLMSGSDKTKLDGIETGAEVNVNADWNSNSGDSQILNKPTVFAPESHGDSAHSETYVKTADSRLSDSRTPLSHGNEAHSSTFVATGDSRLSDARTPLSHNTSHQSGGLDSIKLDDLAVPDDNTDLDATITHHGLLPKLGGGSTNFLRADGTWAAPASSVDTNTRLFTFVLHRGDNATVGANKTNKLIADKSYTINKVYAYATTGPTGTALIFDVNLNGSTIWSTQGNRIQIAAGANYGTQTSFNTTSLIEGDILSIDIDQIGSIIAGSDITVILRCDI
jgi:hypothetical protein